MKRLDGFAYKCFKKVRVTEKVDKELQKLYTERSNLRNKTDAESKEKLDKVEKELAD